WTPDTILVTPEGTHIEPEAQRTWGEAEHHVELARRRGEDAPAREGLFESPTQLKAMLREFGTIEQGSLPEAATIVFPIREPERVGRDIAQLRRMVRDSMRTII